MTNVKDKVTNTADRFGFRNKQQIYQLERLFKNRCPQEVFQGLVDVFKEESDNSSDRQELAGRLLYRISPDANFDLVTELKDCLPYFDLSVEQFPFYFVEQCGLAPVNKAIESFRHKPLSIREKKSLDAIEFWLQNYEKWKNERDQ